MKRIFFLILLSVVVLNATVQVVRASKTIKYKELIDKSEVFLDYVKESEIKKFCSPISKEDILNNKFYAKSFMKKGHIICKKDLYKRNSNNQDKILFNFGSIQIETHGKVIKETKDYIRIKNESGQIEKIYKDGRK